MAYKKITEVAALLGVTRVTLYRMRKAGAIRFTRIGGNNFISTAELDRYLQENTDKTGAEI